MLTVVAEICIKPGCRNSVLEEIHKLIPVVLQEEGCHQYDLLVDHQAQIPWKHNSPDSVFMLEQWSSLRHLEQHQQMPHMEAHRATIKDDVTEVKILVLEPARI